MPAGTATLLIGPEFWTATTRSALGPALWLLLWLAANVNKPEGDWASVLDGKVMTYAAIGASVGESASTVKANCRRLVAAGWLKTERAPRGLRASVVVGKGITWERPPETSPSLPATQAGNDQSRTAAQSQTENRPPESASVPETAGNPPVPRPAVRPERFRPLVQEFVRICRERGWRAITDWTDTETALNWLRGNRGMTTEELVRHLRNFSVAVTREGFTLADFTRFLTASEESKAK